MAQLMAQPYGRIWNFSAGPGTLPIPVLERAKEEMLNWQGAGMSVMEMSHRGKAFERIMEQTDADFRALLGVPTDYKVLYLQGGASTQFTMVPMNLVPEGQKGDYVVTGSWGAKAVEAATLLGKATKVYDAKSTNYDRCPDLTTLETTAGAAYLHMTSNETIQGVDFRTDPRTDLPLVCDMSSNICSRPVDVSRYAVIYAGAQKNLGPAGVTIVVLRPDMLERVPAGLQPMLDYRLQHENGSMYNTPPTWSIYMCGLVFRHWLEHGGLEAVERNNEAKAKVIYDVLDGSGGFYKGHAQPEFRSRMNITFTLPDEDLTNAFLAAAKEHGMTELKGHRSVGGCRASVYNAFPIEGCHALADFMREFQAQQG